MKTDYLFNPKSRGTKPIYPLPNWKYHIKSSNPFTGDKGILIYHALIWKQLWSLITSVSFNHLNKTDMKLGYYNMSHPITERKALSISRCLRRQCLQYDKFDAYLEHAKEKLFRNGQINSIEESRKIFLTSHMLPVLTIHQVEKFAVFSEESAGFRIC